MRTTKVSLDIFSDHTPFLANNFSKSGGVHFSDEIKIILKKIIASELTKKQQEMIYEYYNENKKIPQIAEEYGLNKSTVSRTLNRAREKIGAAMKYGTFNLWQSDDE